MGIIKQFIIRETKRIIKAIKDIPANMIKDYEMRVKFNKQLHKELKEIKLAQMRETKIAGIKAGYNNEGRIRYEPRKKLFIKVHSPWDGLMPSKQVHTDFGRIIGVGKKTNNPLKMMDGSKVIEGFGKALR